MVLTGLSIVLFLTMTVIASWRSRTRIGIQSLVHLRWFWLYMLLFFLPTGIGVYYWFMLRDEQIVVNDEFIERRSLWGDERVYWHRVRAYRMQVLPFRETRLGRIAGLSRWLTNSRIFNRIPPYAYDLVTVDKEGDEQTLRLEPGTVNDLAWLLELIAAHVGEPEVA